jgi:hypothetical protein
MARRVRGGPSFYPRAGTSEIPERRLTLSPSSCSIPRAIIDVPAVVFTGLTGLAKPEPVPQVCVLFTSGDLKKLPRPLRFCFRWLVVPQAARIKQGEVRGGFHPAFAGRESSRKCTASMAPFPLRMIGARMSHILGPQRFFY